AATERAASAARDRLKPAPTKSLLRHGNIDSEEFGQVVAFEVFRGFRFAQALAGVGDQILLVDASKREEKFGSFVEANANSIQHGSDVFAHAGGIRTRAIELYFGRRWKEYGPLPAQTFHRQLRKTAFELR